MEGLQRLGEMVPIIRYGINDARQWDHMGKGQLVVLTSSLEPACVLKLGDTIDPDTWAFSMSGL